MDDKKENKNFFKRWSEKKSGLEKDVSNNDTKIKKKRKNQILESNVDIDKKYEKMSDKEILEKLNLPDPNKVKKEEELDAFFKSSIPERLKRIAMRRLWRINPIISFADSEINDYADDFTDAATVIDDLQTSYVVGQGHGNLDLDENLKEEEQKTKIEKDNVPNETKKAKNKKEIKSEKKIKTDKDQSIFNKQQIKTDVDSNPLDPIKKNKDMKSEFQSSVETNKQIKIKPKNLAFKRK